MRWAAIMTLALAGGCARAAPETSPVTTTSAPNASPSAPAIASATARTSLVDGMYAVTAQGNADDAARFTQSGWRALTYVNHFAEKPEPPRTVALDTKSFVPLEIEGEPEGAPDGRGRTLLMVTLRKEHVATLREFSRAHVGGTVAIVLDGEIVTIHKMRVVIEDGRMQITRCGDDACRVLRSRLAK